MIEKIIQLGRRFNTWADESTAWGSRAINSEKFSQLLFVFVAFGGTWALAWNAHIFFPWLEKLIGLGPSDIDSVGKIRWRRMYSTGFCAPVIIYAIGHYGYSWWRKFADK